MNALIHRSWDLKAGIRIAMFNDKIEISSPGGLPNGISEEEYLKGAISLRRNPIISNVFYRLGIVEIFGTGILRIKQTYENSIKKPIFNISANMIQIVLPIHDMNYTMEEDQKILYDILSKTQNMSISDIMPYVSFGKTKVKKLLKNMESQGIVKIVGNGKVTKYHLY